MLMSPVWTCCIYVELFLWLRLLDDNQGEKKGRQKTKVHVHVAAQKCHVATRSMSPRYVPSALCSTVHSCSRRHTSRICRGYNALLLSLLFFGHMYACASLSHTPRRAPSASTTMLQMYMQSRNYMVRSYQRMLEADADGQAFLTGTECRRKLAGDACSILRCVF